VSQQSCVGLQLGNGKLWAGMISLKQVYETSYFQEVFVVNFNDCRPDSFSSRGDIASFANARIYEHLLLNRMAQE